jgi:hypothetical protein
MDSMGTPSARAKSGPSGMTIMKSSTLTNCTAPMRKTSLRSLMARLDDIDFLGERPAACRVWRLHEVRSIVQS